MLAVDVAGGTATPHAATFPEIVSKSGSGSCCGYLKDDGTCDSGAGFLLHCFTGTTVTASTTFYCLAAVFHSTEGRAQIPMPRAYTARNLRARMFNSVGAALNLSGGTLAVTLREAGADTALTCTVADGSGTCSDTSNSEPIAAGALIALKIVGGTYSTAPYASFSFDCE